MTITYVPTTIGAGTQFTFAAAGDVLVVLPGVTLASTNGVAFNSSVTDIEVTVLGTMVSASQCLIGTNSSFTLAAGGSFLSFEANASNSGLFLNGAGSDAKIDGTFSAPEAIGILSSGGSNRITVTGTMSAASVAFLGLAGATGDIFQNSGSLFANANGDAARDRRFNNAVFTEGANTRITNLAGGTITASSSEGNGVRLASAAGGTVVTNHGTITSQLTTGVDFSVLGVGQSVTLFNTGTITGIGNAFDGSVSTANITILNSGHMIGNVQMGLGNDTFTASGGRIDGPWSGDAGTDRYDGRGASLITGAISGGTGNDTLLGGDGAETINGDDNLDTLRGGGGDDQLFGGTSSDLVSGEAGNDALFGGADFDDMSGGAGDDTLTGDDGGLIAQGGDGDDRLAVDISVTASFVGGYGGYGNDTVQGGQVRDNIYGGAGDDEIHADAGDDFLFGGAGDDLIDAADGVDTVFGGAGDDVISHLLGNADIHGGRGFDSLSGGEGADLLDAGADDDELDGDNGSDTLSGGSGDDVIRGGGGTDLAGGGSGADALLGGLGNDTLAGDAGTDTLTGGAGRDILTGGAGADVFVWLATTESGTTPATRDSITDFTSGTDIIDLSAADADSLLAGNQAFVYIGAGGFTSVAGQLQYQAGLLRGDINGDAVADFVIELLNLPALGATDLVL